MIIKFSSINSNPGNNWRKFFILVILSGCIFLLTSPLAAQKPKKLTVTPTGSASWNDHLTFQQNNLEYGKKPKVIPFMPRPEPGKVGNLITPPRSAQISAPKPKIEGASPLLAVTKSFQALHDSNMSIPPDTMGAAGPNHLMTMLNTDVRIQNKNGTDLGTVTLSTWWTSGTGLSGDPFDPRIIFDSLTSRWMAVVDANGHDLTNSATWFAVSDTSSPTGNWSYYSFNMELPNKKALWHDYPDIGTNTHWIALSNNMFDGSNTFQGLGLIAIDKSTLPPSPGTTFYTWVQGVDSWGGFYGFTLRPALTFDAAEEVLYMVDGNQWASYPNNFPSTGVIRLSQITGNSMTGPTWSFVNDSAGIIPGSGFFWTTESYDPWFQINASQFGTTTRIQTNDSRILNAVFRNGSLWFTHSGGRPNDGSYSATTKDRTVVSWYEVDPLLLNGTGAPTLQSGTLQGGEDSHYFFPSIAVNKNNDVALGFSHSNPDIFVEGVVTGRQAVDPPGTMDPITVIQPGLDSYVKDFGSSRVRWGDYSATVVDPADDTTFWTIQEYADMDVGPGANDDRWGTWWAELSYASSSPWLPAIYQLLLLDE